jgi:hypothetical protein
LLPSLDRLFRFLQYACTRMLIILLTYSLGWIVADLPEARVHTDTHGTTSS